MPWTVFRVVLIASLVFGVPISAGVERAVAQSSLPPCPTDQNQRYDNCYGTYTHPNGDKYVGEFKDNKRNGQGTITFSDGDKYVGEFKDDKRNGQGTYTWVNGEKYVGEWKNDAREGQGTWTLSTGIYVGEFKDDSATGQATWTMPNGDKYVGGFKDGKFNGQGTYTYPDGEKYVGEYKDGKRNGQFVATYSDGAKYVGEFKDDKWNGQGTLTLPDGAKYVGEFKDGKMNGQFVATYSDGDKYVGEFKDNKLNGQFTVTYVNGDSFYGVYQADKREGQGSYVWKNGSKYVGQWKDGLPTLGILTNSSGAIVIGGQYSNAAVYDDVGYMNSPDVLTYSGGTVQQQQQPVSSSDNLRKVAIVIGNGAYENAQPLPNPRNDASAMSQMLTGLGFKVIVAVDANKSQMESSIREFLKEVRNADVSLFFYAGHGMEVAGENFMLPTDTKLEDEAALNFEVINSKVVTNSMGGEKKVGIILLDACRNNPFTRSLKRSMIASRAATVSEGLAAISTEGGGLVIAYATAPGTTASDGDGRNSPFTTALLRWMPEKGLEIEQMLKKVKVEVSSITDNNQRPWTNSDLTMEVYIAGK